MVEGRFVPGADGGGRRASNRKPDGAFERRDYAEGKDGGLGRAVSCRLSKLCSHVEQFREEDLVERLPEEAHA